MTPSRSSGVLLHPTSFPGPYGIGDLGQEAHYFVDFLVAAKQSLWQVLPLGPTGFGDSPYASFSSHAGNPLLINLEALVQEGDLLAQDLASVPAFPSGYVDFGPVITYKTNLLRQAAHCFQATALTERKLAFETFCAAKTYWLDDFALFMALKDAHRGAPWNMWEIDLIQRKPQALDKWRKELADEIYFFKYTQFQFFRQWAHVKQYANQRGIRIVGDIPIFVAPDSADAWAASDIFYMDDQGKLTVVAGVPPDYFSSTGQRWGNPLYRWDVLAADGYAWWLQRIRSVLEMVDILRIDHFRGFQDYWEIPAEEPTAIKGRWLPGPGDDLFKALRQGLTGSSEGALAIIAEDLGIISDEVRALRKRVGLPGMKVLHFAFSEDADHEYLPHNYEGSDYVVYLGTHDNDTTIGWFSALSPQEREFVLRYLGRDGHDVVWGMMHLAFMSIAETAIVTLQDLLKLGGEARMNTPGTLGGGNWAWRYWPGALYDGIAGWLGDLTQTFGRAPKIETR
ncbi:MAG: 4-alpha-glucanotransferase [Anaerolineae bacterium]|nr:4-alpha-glucanotransferase [Anaerolineae bacterium]